jgi:hypothetical protein
VIHGDAGWTEVERRMAAPWVSTAGDSLLGAFSGALWDLAGPLAPAQCLVPALSGLLVALLSVHTRLSTSGVGETRSPRSLSLRLGPLVVLGCCAVAFALAEQQVMGLFPHFPFLPRAILVSAIVAGFTSVFGGKAFATRPATAPRQGD